MITYKEMLGIIRTEAIEGVRNGVSVDRRKLIRSRTSNKSVAYDLRD